MVPGRTTCAHGSLGPREYQHGSDQGLGSLREQPLCFTWRLSFAGIHSDDHHLGGLQIAPQSLTEAKLSSGNLKLRLTHATAATACWRLKPEGSQMRNRPRERSGVDRMPTRTTRMSVPRLGTWRQTLEKCTIKDGS